jgi:hypothetical protein
MLAALPTSLVVHHVAVANRVCAWLVIAGDLILGDTSMPWLFGVGVAGGMALWSNPVKGAVLGPLITAAASAFHQEGVQLLSSQSQAMELRAEHEAVVQPSVSATPPLKKAKQAKQSTGAGKAGQMVGTKS